jgi:hypothetical protein
MKQQLHQRQKRNGNSATYSDPFACNNYFLFFIKNADFRAAYGYSELSLQHPEANCLFVITAGTPPVAGITIVNT